MKITVQFNFS